jgi:hypothetical protein
MIQKNKNLSCLEFLCCELRDHQANVPFNLSLPFGYSEEHVQRLRACAGGRDLIVEADDDSDFGPGCLADWY